MAGSLVINSGVIVYAISATFISLSLCLLAPLIGKTFGLIDDPKAKTHSLHNRTTPLVGGLAIIAPWILLTKIDAMLAGFFITHDDASDLPAFFSVFVLVFMLIGTLDDRFHLSARLRLVIMAPLFTLFAIEYPDFAINALTSPAFGISVHLGFLAAPFTALCMLAYTNAVNMADGRNGLVIGLSIIWCLTLSFYVPAQFQVMLYVVLASLLVTGVFNMTGRLFLGDGGTYALSAMIGLTGLYAHGIPVGAGGASSTQLAALFAIPGLDMFRLIVSRITRGVSPMSADHDHLHHRLDRHIGWRWGLPAYLALVGGPVLIAFSAPNMGSMGLVAAVGLYGAAWIVTRGAQQQTFSSVAEEASVPVQ